MNKVLTKEERKEKYMRENPDEAYLFVNEGLIKKINRTEIAKALKGGKSMSNLREQLKLKNDIKKIQIIQIKKKTQGNHEARNVEIIALRLKGTTLRKVGARFNISHERVRQILTMYDFDGYKIPLALYSWKCQSCGKIGKVKKNLLFRKYCDRGCQSKANLMGKPYKEATPEDWIAFNRKRNFYPVNVARRKEYYAKNREKIRALGRTDKSRQYQREYYHRPEVVAKRKAQKAGK